MRSLFSAALTAAFVAVGATAATAQAWGIRSNDTGGIIPWSPEIAHTFREIAAAECARWYKVAYITSVHPVYGDYVGFVCVFPRDFDPAKAWYTQRPWWR